MKIIHNNEEFEVITDLDEFDNERTVTDVLNNWLRLHKEAKRLQKRRERIEKINNINAKNK